MVLGPLLGKLKCMQKAFIGRFSSIVEALWAMENWHLFTAAFVLSLVDLSVLGAFLWYQFSTLYFAWHLCPMIVNRICELIAFMFTGGMLPSLFAIVQVPLSLFSTTVYANRQQHLQNKLLLAVYCTLLVYEFLVAVLMIKMGRYLKYPTHLGPQHSRSPSSRQAPQPYIAFHMFALFTQPVGPGCPYVSNPEPHEGSQMEGFVTVQQPDGQKVMLGKVLQSKVEAREKAEAAGGGGLHPDRDVSITITPLPNQSSDDVPVETDHGSSPSQLSDVSSESDLGNYHPDRDVSITITPLPNQSSALPTETDNRFQPNESSALHHETDHTTPTVCEMV